MRYDVEKREKMRLGYKMKEKSRGQAETEMSSGHFVTNIYVQ
jgi:hypothetical protein